MAVVLAPTNRNHGRAQQWRKAEQCARKIAAGINGFRLLVIASETTTIFPTNTCARPDDKETHLACKEQAQISQSRKAEARVPARKAAPTVVQDVVARLGAHVERDQFVGWRAGGGFAARQKVGTRAADGIFYGIGEERGQNQGNEEAEDGDVMFVG